MLLSADSGGIQFYFVRKVVDEKTFYCDNEKEIQLGKFDFEICVFHKGYREMKILEQIYRLNTFRWDGCVRLPRQ